MTSPQPAAAQQSPPPDHQASQAALAILVGLAVAKLWPSLDLLHLNRSLPAFKAAVAQEVRRHAQASATLAARQYRQQRVAAGVGAGFTPVPADPPTLAQIAATVDWATAPLWDTSVPVASFPGAPEETKQAAGSAIADAKARLAAASERMVLDTGRDTILGNSQRDRRAKGWARIAEPGACSFCAMLAIRGAVYHDRKSASFRSHDNCRCHVEPVFTAYEAPARVREWQRVYEQATAGVDGSQGKQKAFRQAFEGRKVTATSTSGPRKGKPGTKPTQQSGGRTQEQIRAELTALEDNFPRLTNDQQREWTSKRIDTLHKQLGDAGGLQPQ